MTTFKTFEDIEAWQRARELTREIYRVTAKGALVTDVPLRNQMRRAAISIVSNIAEGFERSGRGDFTRGLTIAKGSAGEIVAQLYIGSDLGYLSKGDFEGLRAKALETGRMIGGLIGYLKRTKSKSART